MIQRIDLHHFKCFELLRLPLRSLTLLTGSNSSGKSSILQALALFNQTILDQEWSRALILNGPSVCLGTAGEVINQISGGRECRIGLCNNENEFRWEFEANRSDMSLAIMRVSINERFYNVPNDDSPFLHQLLPNVSVLESSRGQRASRLDDLVKQLCELAYLTAERLGSKEVYQLIDHDHSSAIGAKGGMPCLFCMLAGTRKLVLLSS